LEKGLHQGKGGTTPPIHNQVLTSRHLGVIVAGQLVKIGHVSVETGWKLAAEIFLMLAFEGNVDRPTSL